MTMETELAEAPEAPPAPEPPDDAQSTNLWMIFALSSAKDVEKIAYSVYERGDYNIYVVDRAEVLTGTAVRWEGRGAGGGGRP